MNIHVKNVEGIWFGVACDEKEVFATTFASSKEKALQGLRNSIPFQSEFNQSDVASALVEHVITTLKNIFDGKEVSYSFRLAMNHLSNHTQRVLRATSAIPLGYVASYGSVAKVTDSSPRGVGRVMALNPFAPIVPCHRVVGSDFTLVGYAGGLAMKKAFLERERKGFTAEKEVLVNGKKLQILPVEHILRKLKKG